MDDNLFWLFGRLLTVASLILSEITKIESVLFLHFHVASIFPLNFIQNLLTKLVKLMRC